MDDLANDPGIRALTAELLRIVEELDHPQPAPVPITGLPEPRASASISETDILNAAALLTCEPACVKAVIEVESAGKGFLPSGRPTILFESRQFSIRTRGLYNASHPTISTRTFDQTLYKGGEAEYVRLSEALLLNKLAALQSCSWGLFQLMGFNYRTCGFQVLDQFIKAMYESESRHLEALIMFLQGNSLDRPLREHRWKDFARGYNGPNYAVSRYDLRLAAAFLKFSKMGV
jgi:hypothetical protein